MDEIKSLAIKHGADMIVIDQLSLMSDKRRADIPRIAYNNISEDLFLMSKELKKPVLLMAQANREAVKNRKKGESPELHDLAESDGVGQNATRVLSLSVIDGTLKISIKKNRYGINNKEVLMIWEVNTGCSTKQTKGRRTRKRDSTMGKTGEINPLGCDNENISYNSLMEIMGVVSERLQANTDTIKHDMINWLTKLRKQLLEANGGHTEADLQRELSRKSKLLDAYLDGILNKQEYQKKAEELDERIIQLKAETEKNKANSGDIAEIDKVLANIDEEVSRYVDGNEKLKVEYLLEHLEQVQIFPDKVIVIVPILSEGIVVEKAQYVSREKWSREDDLPEDDQWTFQANEWRD